MSGELAVVEAVGLGVGPQDGVSAQIVAHAVVAHMRRVPAHPVAAHARLARLVERDPQFHLNRAQMGNLNT